MPLILTKAAAPAPKQEGQARESVFGKSLRDFLALSDEEFRALFAKSPIKRIKRPEFLRNVCVALGNVRTARPLITEHAQWAISEIRSRT